MDEFPTQSAQYLHLMNLLQIPAITIFFYDWALTLGDEVELVWSRKNVPGRALFIILRLAGLAIMCNLLRGIIMAPNEPENMCDPRPIPVPWIFSSERLIQAGSRRISLPVRALCMAGILVIVQVILQIRVYAMYSSSRRILWTNAALFLLEWSTTLVLYLVFSRNIEHFPTQTECGLCDHYPRQLGTCYIPLLVYETYLCSLVVRKSFSVKSTFEGSGVNGVWGVLIRDSVVYFVLVASALALSLIMFFAAPDVSQWTDAFLDSLGVVGGARIILSLRRAASPTPEEAFTLETLTSLRRTVLLETVTSSV